MSEFSKRNLALIAVVAVVTFSLMAGMVWAVKKYTTPAPFGKERAEQRRKALAEVRAADAAGLNGYGWVDQPKGIVRIPVEVAMKITEREWRNPAAARSNLVARAEAAAAKPPEKPSQYE